MFSYIMLYKSNSTALQKQKKLIQQTTKRALQAKKQIKTKTVNLNIKS